jgi:hypothetical protein
MNEEVITFLYCLCDFALLSFHKFSLIVRFLLLCLLTLLFIFTTIFLFISFFLPTLGSRGGAVVEALRSKPEGRGIDSRRCHWNFSLT